MTYFSFPDYSKTVRFISEEKGLNCNKVSLRPRLPPSSISFKIRPLSKDVATEAITWGKGWFTGHEDAPSPPL